MMKMDFFKNLIVTRYELESLKIRIPNFFIIIVNYYKFTSSDSHLPEQIVLLLIWVSAVHVYPLSLKCDRHQFSPNNCHAQSIGKVMRINKMINKGTRTVQTLYWRNQTKNHERTTGQLKIWLTINDWLTVTIDGSKRTNDIAQAL